MATKKSTRATRSKQETAAEFGSVREQVAEREPVPEGEKAQRTARESTLRSTVEQFSLETAVQVLTASGLGMSRALTDLTNKLQETAKQVDELKEAKDLLEKDIEDLHGKEISASALEDLVADYNEREETLRRELVQLQTDIQFRRQEAQSAWQREQAEHERQVMERSNALLESRRREQEQYDYSKGQERLRAEQTFQNNLADQKRANDLKQAELARDWAMREAALKEKEQEFAALQARVAGIQAEIDAAVKKEVAIVSNSLSRDNKHQVEILVNNQQAEKTVLNARITSLQEQLAVANTTIASLNAQLSKAQEKVAEIAASALTAASGSQTLREMQNFVAVQGPGNAAKKA